MMRLILIVCLVLGMFAAGCATDEEPSDAPEMSEAEQKICSSGCSGLEGAEWQGCIDENCGGTGGGGSSGGGGGGGGGGSVTCQSFPGYPVTNLQCPQPYVILYEVTTDHRFCSNGSDYWTATYVNVGQCIDQ